MNKQIAIILVIFFFSAFVKKVAAQRSIHFAGVDWLVKNGGPMGPGPNYWSNSENSVWLDDSNRLHLTIRKVGGRWYCSEIYTKEFSTYGEHRFFVDGFMDRMDKNIVLGLFTYAGDSAEIDIEYSKWGQETKEEVGSYTVQPWSTEGNSYSFKSPLSGSKTTHFFNWQPGYILFGSIYGHYEGAPPSTGDYIAQWVYTGPDIPDASENLRTHINFWLNNGIAPTDQSILEVIITDLRQPLSTRVEADKPGQLPKQIMLLQNYPNPFNPTTVIGYRLPVSGKVSLSVYDIRGQKVQTLVERRQQAGEHKARFNGSGFVSGVYYYALFLNKSFIASRKMILLK